MPDGDDEREQAEADLYYIQTMAEELGSRQYTIGFDIVYTGPSGGYGGGSGGGGESGGDGGGGDSGGGGGAPTGGGSPGGGTVITQATQTLISGWQQTEQQVGMGGGVFAFAEGGRSPGGLALVGEEGPELVHLPGGSLVTPASETRALFAALPDGGGGVTYNTIYLDVEVNGVQDAERLVKELRRELRAQGMDFAEVK